MNDIDLIHYMLLMNVPAYVFLACLLYIAVRLGQNLCFRRYNVVLSVFD
ncbi:hypothetical protein GKR23_07615 [Staphylococcus aureus]|nr:hypothetical protein [Staphylococcus aureus]